MDPRDIPRVYLTMACNFQCAYCPQIRPPKNRASIPAGEWIEILNSWSGDAVILAGGEPTIRLDFAEIVNGLRHKEVRLYSNLSFSVSLLDRIKRPLAFYASFHPSGKVDASRAASLLLAALAKKHRLINVHINRAAGDPATYIRIFRRQGFDLKIEDDLFKHPNLAAMRKFPLGKVVCSLRRTYLGPDGKRYICVRKLEEADPTGIVDHRNPVAVLPCDRYGECSPCDCPHRTVASGKP